MARKLSESTKIILGTKPCACDMIVRQQVALQQRQSLSAQTRVFGDLDSARARQFGFRVHHPQNEDGSEANDENLTVKETLTIK